MRSAARILPQTHLRQTLPERANAVQHLEKDYPEGPHVHLGADPRVVAKALRREVPKARNESSI